MMIKRISMLLLLPGLLMVACGYSETDNYYVEPIPGEPTAIVVHTSLDTMYDLVIADSLLVVYRAEISNGELYFMECFHEDNKMYEKLFESDPDSIQGGYIEEDSFYIYPIPEIENDITSLIMSFFVSTNSNSLADLVDIETKQLDVEYIMMNNSGAQ